MDGPHLRPASESDRELLWRLHVETMKEYVAATWGWDEAEQRRRFDEGFDPRAREIVELEGDPVGYVAVARLPDRLRLLSIEIAAAHQRRGLGTKLVKDVLARAEEAGLPVDLRVLRVNPARRLYERLGFRVASRTPTHYVMEHPGGRGAGERGG